MPSSASSRRMTRSQTSSVLGKRSGGTLSRSSSTASIRSSALLTPETTPDAKKPRISTGDTNEDPSGNKENIPPLKNTVMETPVARRLTRRATTTEEIVSPTATRSRQAPRRTATVIPTTPQTPSTAIAQLTIQTPPPTPLNSLSLHVRARGCLRATSNATHVNMSCEGRAKETEIIRSFLVHQEINDEDEEVSKPILYISGTPGTGKTALVNSILSSLEIPNGLNIKTVFLNCMAYQNVDAVWDRLHEELLGTTKRVKRASSSKQKTSKDVVMEFIRSNRDMKLTVILDEMDHLLSISSIALRPLFSLATQYPSTARIMGIANTHTLTSSTSLPFDASTTQHIETIHFKPYEPSQLLSILNKRLEGLPQDDLKKMLPQPSLILLTKKVASRTGDVRVLFEVLRAAIGLAAPSNTSLASSDQSPVVVTPTHILAAFNSHLPSNENSKVTVTGRSTPSMSANNEIVSKIHGLGLQHRLALLSLLLATKRLTSGLPLSSSASSTPTASPTKRSPMKRAQSSASVGFAGEIAGDASSGIDVNSLFSYYTNLLQSASAIGAVSRSEFADLLAVLETTGLLNIQSTSPGRSSFKRSSSFIGRSSMAAGSTSPQTARLHNDVREVEVARGMGLEDSSSPSASEGVPNAMQEEVRAIWMRERIKIRKEREARQRKAMADGVDLFDDAMES